MIAERLSDKVDFERMGCPMQLKIDPEFRDKIPPLTAHEFRQLEDNIVKAGKVRDPIVIWDETIIDGHNRWAIIQRHPEIPYTVDSMEFPDRYAAIVWICQNQLGKRNLTNEQKTYLIGKQYEAERHCEPFHGNQHTKRGDDQSGQHQKETTRQRIARETGTSEGTVQRAEHFAKGLDSADTVSPGFKESVLSGAIKAPKTVISSLSKMDEPEQKKTIQAIQAVELTQLRKPAEVIESDCEEYNSDDLKMELDACTVTFYKNFKDTLVFHSTMIQEEECKQKIETALGEAEAAIKKLRGYIS